MNDYLERSFGLKGRRAVVTGAGRGIGRAVAEALASVGAEVCVHFNTSGTEAGQTVERIVANGGNAWSFKADLTDSAQAAGLFSAVAERWGALDILVNNAGDLVQRSAIADMPDELVDRIVRINLHTTVFSCRAAIPLLRKGRSASIVNLSSIATHTGGAGGAILYAAVKAAVHTLTRGLAKELAPGVRVNAIAPGVVLTDFHKRHSSPAQLEAFEKSTPLGRLGKAEDMSAAVVFLCGDGASFVTGEVIELNGGAWVA